MLHLFPKALVLLFILFLNVSFGQPPNDEIATAIDVSTIPYTDVGVNVASADTEGPVPASDGTCFDNRPMVWYKFTFTLGANLTISTSTNFSLLILYTAPNESVTDFSSLTPLFTCANTSGIFYTTSPNQSYYVLVGSWASSVDISFTGDFIPPPPPPPVNDKITTAIEIASFPHTDPQINFPQADTEGPVPASDGPCHFNDPSIWYKFSTASSGTLGVYSPTSVYVIVVFYTAPNLNVSSTLELTPVSTCSGSTLGVGTTLSANQNYYVMVATTAVTDIVFSSSVILPVDFSYFNAKQKDNLIKLEWETSSEINNEGFALEKMHNNQWIEIGFIRGKGSSNIHNKYKFYDRTPSEGKNHYRLRQIDYDGNCQYSEIRIAYFYDINYSIEIYPNPIQDLIIINTPKGFGNYSCKLFSINGDVILSENFTSSKVELSLSNFISQIYLLEIVGNKGQRFTQLITKQ